MLNWLCITKMHVYLSLCTNEFLIMNVCIWKIDVLTILQDSYSYVRDRDKYLPNRNSAHHSASHQDIGISRTILKPAIWCFPQYLARWDRNFIGFTETVGYSENSVSSFIIFVHGQDMRRFFFLLKAIIIFLNFSNFERTLYILHELWFYTKINLHFKLNN